MSTGTPDFEILRLWPNTMLVQELPRHEEYTRRLIELSGQQPDAEVFSIADHSVEWLHANIAHGLGAYLQRAQFPRAPQWRLLGRFDIHRFDDFRSLRNTPGAYLAGMYVLHTPSREGELGIRDDRAPGCITFYDPRTGINMNAIKRDPYVGYNQTFTLQSGVLLMWPAYVDYFIHPNLSSDPAIRVVFDVQLRHDPQPS